MSLKVVSTRQIILSKNGNSLALRVDSQNLGYHCYWSSEGRFKDKKEAITINLCKYERFQEYKSAFDFVSTGIYPATTSTNSGQQLFEHTKIYYVASRLHISKLRSMASQKTKELSRIVLRMMKKDTIDKSIESVHYILPYIMKYSFKQNRRLSIETRDIGRHPEVLHDEVFHDGIFNTLLFVFIWVCQSKPGRQNVSKYLGGCEQLLRYVNDYLPENKRLIIKDTNGEVSFKRKRDEDVSAIFERLKIGEGDVDRKKLRSI